MDLIENSRIMKVLEAGDANLGQRSTREVSWRPPRLAKLETKTPSYDQIVGSYQ